jgi:hypothetical protein
MPPRASLILAILMLLVSAPTSCETSETTGRITSREIRINESEGSGPDSIVLRSGTVTLTDDKGRKAVLTASGIRFYSSDGKLVAETPAPTTP